jgi:hypothetical protein
MTKLTERDLKFLSTLGDYELMSTSQIVTHIFKGIDKKTVLRRLRKLEKEKLIKRTYGLQTNELVWSLAHYGAFKIHREGFPEHINRNSLEHDITLTEVRLTLEGAGIATSWRTEQSLRRLLPKDKGRFTNELCPDAIFAIKTATGYQGVGLELELSGKNSARYAKVFDAYGVRKNYFALWYVVESEALGRKLQREWTKCNPKVLRPKFGWMLLNELLKSPDEAKIFSDSAITKMSSIINRPQTLSPALSQSTVGEAAHPSAERVGNRYQETPSQISNS